MSRSNIKTNIAMIKMSEVKFVNNSRISHRKSDLEELIGSIKVRGLMQPIGVQKMTEPSATKKYVMAFGHRRFHACKKIGYKEIAAHIYEPDEDPGTAELDIIFMNLSENLQRKNINLYELGTYCKSLVDEWEMTPKEISESIKVNHNLVKSALTTVTRVPEEFAKDIETAPFGAKTRTPNKISASISNCIINMQVKHKLKKDKVSKLFALAKKDDELTEAKVKVMMGLMDQGATFEKALKKMDSVDVVRVTLVIDKDEREELRQKGYTIQALGNLIYSNTVETITNPCL